MNRRESEILLALATIYKSDNLRSPVGGDAACEIDMNTRLSDLAVSDSGFVFDPFSGGTFTLNETGRAVLNGLREGLSESQIVERLRLEFNAVTPKVEEDVRDFLRTINEFGLSE